MHSGKALLHDIVELLSEEEAQQILAFVQRLQRDRKGSNVSLTMRRLASDPAFKMPTAGCSAFRDVTPVQGRGIAASRLLLEDRR
jgi:hypothetical protein